MKWKIDKERDLEKVVEKVFEIIEKKINKEKKATVIALYGDLGSGKTTFTKYLAKFLGIKDLITSPTFVIQKSFSILKGFGSKKEIFKKLIHIDAYRIESAEELIKLNWIENISQAENLIVVEWPEKILEILPKEIIPLHFNFINETTREVSIEEIDNFDD